MSAVASTEQPCTKHLTIRTIVSSGSLAYSNSVPWRSLKRCPQLRQYNTTHKNTDNVVARERETRHHRNDSAHDLHLQPREETIERGTARITLAQVVIISYLGSSSIIFRENMTANGQCLSRPS